MNEEPPRDLRRRTSDFALRIIRMSRAIPRGWSGEVIGKQVLRSGTSVGAQYREASRARSLAEFISKIQCATQELDETAYWLELIVESGLLSKGRLKGLRLEAEELTAIFTKSVLTARKTKVRSEASKE